MRPGVALRFEHDPAKAASNLAKHGVAFEDAREVFSDPLHLTRPDRGGHGEARWIAVGQVGPAVLVVVFSQPGPEDDDLVRLISARPATRAERRRYGNDDDSDA